ncbi:MAG: O-antigen ligase family protein, partial [Acidobacteriota bacterium]
VQPLLPAILVLAFAASLGTFPGAADGVRAVLGHATLLGTLWLGAEEALRRPRWLFAASIIVAAVFVAWTMSPVGRAGATGVTLLPAFLAIPPAVAACWRDDTGRRRGVTALVAVLGLIAGWALLAQILDRTPGASAPFGHHNLLAAWLLALLPLAALSIRHSGRAGALGVIAGLLGVVALVATESLGGLLGLGAMLAVGAWRLWRSEHGAAARWAVSAIGFVVAITAVQHRRLQMMLEGADPSVLARWSYWQAGWEGWLARPWLGWGPGASRWTLAEWMRPVPGVHPPDQVVADLHGLGPQVLYELGVVGAVGIAIACAALVARRSQTRDADLARAADAGLIGSGVVGVVSGIDLAATALPVVVLAVIGARLAADPVPPVLSRRSRRVVRLVAAVIVLALAVTQWPRDAAHLAYDQALVDEDPKPALARAVALDPEFPAYRWRLAEQTDDADAARRAAETARGLAPLWTTAGVTAGTTGGRLDPADVPQPLVLACDLSPLGALPAFRLAIDGDPALATDRAVRALMASPLLLAAIDGARRDRLVEAAVRRIDRWRLGPDAIWREAFLTAAATVRDVDPEPVRRAAIGLVVDAEPATALSLHAFRRRPWRAVLLTVEVDLDRVAVLQDLLGGGVEIGPGLESHLLASSCRLARPPWAAKTSVDGRAIGSNPVGGS